MDRFVCHDLARVRACVVPGACTPASRTPAPHLVWFVRVENGRNVGWRQPATSWGTLVVSCHSISRASSSRALFAVVGVVFRCKHSHHGICCMFQASVIAACNGNTCAECVASGDCVFCDGGVFTLCLDKFVKCRWHRCDRVLLWSIVLLLFSVQLSVGYKRSNSLHLPQIRFQVCLFVGSSFVIFFVLV